MAGERSLLRRALLIVSALMFATPALAAAESCTTCHPRARTAFAAGVHARRLGCTDCHGGDPEVVGAGAHAPEKGYVGVPPREQIPALCARCHADPVRMKPFGLPTDQYAKYQTSEHGIALAKGDGRVAVCSDCHGSHDIVAADEPTSPVARANVNATCGRCHSDAARMAAYGLPTGQESEFRGSVHGVALYQTEHPAAPTCASCHGAHGATVAGTSPATSCGHCHQRTLDYFNESPHRAAAEAGKVSACVSCHGSHAIHPPDHALFDEACGKCHAPDTPAYAAGQNLKTLLSRSAEALDLASQELREGAELSPTLRRLDTYLLQGRAYHMEALPVQHSLDAAKVEDLTRGARTIAEDVRSSVHGVAYGTRVRYLELAVVLVFLLFTAAAALLYRAELQRRRAARPTESGLG